MTTRKLTAGEIALCKTVFGQSIDYSTVLVHSKAFVPFIQQKGCSMAPNGQLYMYGTYMEDYAAGGPEWRTHFIHEMTHVWQYQNKVLDPVKAFFELSLAHKFNYAAAYAYKLNKGKDLTEYNMEQQASIVEDYYAITHEKPFWHDSRCQNKENFAEIMALYRDVLKNFLSDPNYMRKNTPPAPPTPGV